MPVYQLPQQPWDEEYYQTRLKYIPGLTRDAWAAQRRPSYSPRPGNRPTSPSPRGTQTQQGGPTQAQPNQSQQQVFRAGQPFQGSSLQSLLAQRLRRGVI